MAIRTIFSMVEDCARGDRPGWQEFVRDYAEIARTLLTHYFPTLAPELDAHVVGVFRRAGAHQNPKAKDGIGITWFASLKFTNEREFLMAFRELVFAYGREQEGLRVPEASLEQVRAGIKDLSLLEREMLWLLIKGYDAPRIAAIMMNAAATADAVQRMADTRLSELLTGGALETIAAVARVLMESAEESKSEQCASFKTFNNLVNGQISWREREVAQEHMNDCFYCIDRFTSFQEMIWMRKSTATLNAPQVEAILDQLPFVIAKSGGVLSRLFAGR